MLLSCARCHHSGAAERLRGGCHTHRHADDELAAAVDNMTAQITRLTEEQRMKKSEIEQNANSIDALTAQASAVVGRTLPGFLAVTEHPTNQVVTR